jgi:CPA1 family monovalent cation:H+ antiporter
MLPPIFSPAAQSGHPNISRTLTEAEDDAASGHRYPGHGGIREAHQDFTNLIIPILLAIVIVLASRGLAVYPLSILFSRSHLKVQASHQHILFWGGLRGALALALALGLPPEIAHREMIITVAFGVVAFSIIVQGLTVIPLLRKLKEVP